MLFRQHLLVVEPEHRVPAQDQPRIGTNDHVGGRAPGRVGRQSTIVRRGPRSPMSPSHTVTTIQTCCRTGTPRSRTAGRGPSQAGPERTDAAAAILLVHFAVPADSRQPGLPCTWSAGLTPGCASASATDERATGQIIPHRGSHPMRPSLGRSRPKCRRDSDGVILARVSGSAPRRANSSCDGVQALGDTGLGRVAGHGVGWQ